MVDDMTDHEHHVPPRLLDALAHESNGYAAAAHNVLTAPHEIDHLIEILPQMPPGGGEEVRFAVVDALVERGEELALSSGWLNAWLSTPDMLCFADATDEDHDHDNHEDHEQIAAVQILGDLHRHGSRQTVSLRMTVAEALEFAQDIIRAASQSAQHATRHGWALSTDGVDCDGD